MSTNWITAAARRKVALHWIRNKPSHVAAAFSKHELRELAEHAVAQRKIETISAAETRERK